MAIRLTGTLTPIGEFPVCVVGDVDGALARQSGTTAERPTSPLTGDLYFDTTLNCHLVWSGTAWQLPIRPGYADLLGDVEQAAATGALTNEVYRDTQFSEYFFHRSQDDTLRLRYQMPHDWDLGAVEPHIHIIGTANITGNVRFSGRYAWSSIGGGGLSIPAWADWSTFAVTLPITAAEQWTPKVAALGAFTPPVGARYPSAMLRIQVMRPGSSDALDTYEGDKPDHTAAANVMLDGVDCHVMVTGLNTAALYA